MTDVETRLRATLHAVAEATGAATTEPMPPYVEATRRRRPTLGLLAAAAALAVVVAAVALRPNGRQDAPPAAQTPTTTNPVPAGPAGGRLMAQGTFGAERWALYGVDRLPDMKEPQCFVLAVGTREHAPRGCGFDGGRPDDPWSYRQLGPALESGDSVLVFGVLDFEVADVLVELQTSKRQETIVPVADPAHPDGARYFVMVVPRSEGAVRMRLSASNGVVLDVSDVRVDGPVGG